MLALGGPRLHYQLLHLLCRVLRNYRVWKFYFTEYA